MNNESLLRDDDVVFSLVPTPKHIPLRRVYNVATFVTFCYTFVVLEVFLSNSSQPYEGFVQIKTDSEPLRVKYACYQSLKEADNVICRQLGYTRADSLVEKTASPVTNDAKFNGTIDCSGHENRLSQCSTTNSDGSCPQLSYINCEFFE